MSNARSTAAIMNLSDVIHALAFTLCAIAAFGVSYQLAAVAILRRMFPSTIDEPLAGETAASLPPVSVLKPVCGRESGLFESLSSFCIQDYAAYEILIGASDRQDPAMETAVLLRAAFPRVPIWVCAPATLQAMNGKVGALDLLVANARHEMLAISDSDINVSRVYLKTIIRELTEPGVGAVTCAYAARPGPGLWSELGALGINSGFLPSVAFSHRFGIVEGAYGATIALSKATLERVGGMGAFRDEIADDFKLGGAVRKTGGAVKLSSVLVDTRVEDPDLPTLFARELRWSRTIRSVAPFGHALSVMTNPVAIGTLAAILGGGGPLFIAILGIAVAGRYFAILQTAELLGTPVPSVAVALIRDGLSFAVYAASFASDSISWRGKRMKITRGGHLAPERDR